jgi:hypothetical protein
VQQRQSNLILTIHGARGMIYLLGRVDSVVALRTFVDAMQDLDDLRPILPHLLDELFRLMSEVCPPHSDLFDSGGDELTPPIRHARPTAPTRL